MRHLIAAGLVTLTSLVAMTGPAVADDTSTAISLPSLELQSETQTETTQFTAVSNIMKTKHDTVKNSISNVR